MFKIRLLSTIEPKEATPVKKKKKEHEKTSTAIYKLRTADKTRRSIKKTHTK